MVTILGASTGPGTWRVDFPQVAADGRNMGARIGALEIGVHSGGDTNVGAGVGMSNPVGQ